jgi:cytochrome c-type biogenesis protein CcsB
MSFAETLGTAAFILFLASAALQIVWIFRRDSRQDPASHWILLAAGIALVIDLVLRSIQTRFVALTSTYESLLFYAAALAILCFAYRVQKKRTWWPLVAFGSSFAGIVLLAVASSPLIPKEALPPIPALQSGWLLLHVSFSFIGEAFFVVSFVAALLFLATKDEDRRLDLDRVTYTAIAVGYPIFTAGVLVFGAIWAERAWGRWWSWDPKETWALVTWLVYTAYLHLRLIRKRKDKWPAILAVAGFLCTVFTFFGVNYLLPGMHSYG